MLNVSLDHSFKCNLFQINWGRSVAFVLIPDLYIHELLTNNYEKNKLTHKIPRVKNLAREEILDP